MSTQVTTPEFRVSFVKLFNSETRNGRETFSAELLFPESADLSGMKAAASAAAERYFKQGIPGNLESPFKSGTEYNNRREAAGKQRLAGYDGMTMVRVKTFEKPTVVDQNVKAIPSLDSPLSEKDVYAGSYGYAQLGAAGWTKDGRNGVTFYLNMYQFARDGERLDSRQDANDVFNVIPGGASPAPNGAGEASTGTANSGGLFD